MTQILRQWWARYFGQPDVFVLVAALLIVVLGFYWLGAILIPVFLSIILSYLLDGLVVRLDRLKVPHVISVTLVCLLSLGGLLLILLWLLPLIWQQLSSLIGELPKIIRQGEQFLATLPQKYPEFINATQLNNILAAIQNDMTRAGRALLSYSVAGISSFMEIIVYFILVPLMVFFFLKDKKYVIDWCKALLPQRNNRLLLQVIQELDLQMGNYVRGKVLEILIVGAVSSVIFLLMGLNYAVLLGVLLGVSTIIPFIGAFLATIPVIVIAYVQWGWSMQFLYLVIVYTIISTLDGNLLVPLLFSETMELHPVVVIVAIIVFGGLFGFWGIFFAIPLATVVRAVFKALQNENKKTKETQKQLP